MLELGCGDGANLLPQAYFRRHASFVGVDGARTQIAIANARQSELSLSNVEFVHSDFRSAIQRISGPFDYIIAHGIFSWVPDDARDALLELCAGCLKSDGLLYLNYNARPGWNVRGPVRDFLMAQTAGFTDFAARARHAHHVAAQVVSALTLSEHPYSKLILNEFQFVCESDVSYVGHEYLAADNHPYWRSEFLALAHAHGLAYVADADFNYSSGRLPPDLTARLCREQIVGWSIDDTVDLLCYRQLHSPILTPGPFVTDRPDPNEFASLLVASCLSPCAQDGAPFPMFEHPSGYQVEAKEEVVSSALRRLQPVWPRGLPIGEVFDDVPKVREDLMLLHRSGLIELRCVEPGNWGVDPTALNRLEHSRGYATTPYHTREEVKPNLCEREDYVLSGNP